MFVSESAVPSPRNENMNTRLLIVLDLNGTIIDRVKETSRKLARANPHCPIEPNFTSNKAKIYFRPHLETFLTLLFDNFTVAAWTSAQPNNALPLAHGVFGKYFDKLAFVWNRSHCSAVKESRKDHSSIKDLRKVWVDPSRVDFSTLGREEDIDVHCHGPWSPRNTVLLDDTPYKASYTPNNIIPLPTFTVTDADNDQTKDTVLLSVCSYLLDLRAAYYSSPSAYFSDVRSFLTQRPLFTTHQAVNEEKWISSVGGDSDTQSVASSIRGSISGGGGNGGAESVAEQMQDLRLTNSGSTSPQQLTEMAGLPNRRIRQRGMGRPRPLNLGGDALYY
ncbi:hypothetical protein SmJEL517_g04072 [Synchytrium microbalum]|uniref:Mitochondrial import inner membrane translocase subunit TIM50 n=1 Tax=Synchytrium microbalum TaxID=1806994 RepID=A0A507BVG1_9FUNG|nr:uncharacterized protein SmJEL517_g04072 [Synchytrium microbalum]TPX32877.1 hypothetical protein SmJEL517_g04072 [Synchytrium microbalum]